MQTGIRVGDDRADRLVDLMGNRRCEFAQSCDASDMRELGTSLRQRFFGLLRAHRGGYIAADAAVTEEPALAVKDRFAAC